MNVWYGAAAGGWRGAWTIERAAARSFDQLVARTPLRSLGWPWARFVDRSLGHPPWLSRSRSCIHLLSNYCSSNSGTCHVLRIIARTSHPRILKCHHKYSYVGLHQLPVRPFL